MPTISNTPRPGFVYDSTDDVWYPIGTGTHNHSEIAKTLIDAKGDLIVGTAADTVTRLAVGATNGMVLTVDSAEATGLKYATPAAGGKVLQVVSASTSTPATSTSTTPADTNLTCNITPTLNTSKVLILVTQMVRWSRASDGGGIGMRIMRDSTAVYDPDLNTGQTSMITAEVLGQQRYVSQTLLQTLNYLDSPATTSATTYKTQFRVNDSGSSSTSTCQFSNTTSVITLLEIGA